MREKSYETWRATIIDGQVIGFELRKVVCESNMHKIITLFDEIQSGAVQCNKEEKRAILPEGKSSKAVRALGNGTRCGGRVFHHLRQSQFIWREGKSRPKQFCRCPRNPAPLCR